MTVKKLPVEQPDMSHLDVDYDAIRALANVLDETGLTEIEICEGERRVRVARAPAPVSASFAGPAVAAPAAAAQPAEAPTAGTAGDDAGGLDASHPGAVTSPMVGTAYRSPEPGAPAFVKEGDTVSEGQTLFIVEAMKTMNPIRAPRGGRVTHIAVENGAPVEFGEVLLVIE